MRMLLIETATSICSVALTDGGEVCQVRQSAESGAHSASLTLFIDDVLKAQGLRPCEIDAVCVSSGPGSYTGLRIGVSTAKGLCYALNKPLVAVPTLLSMAALYYARHPHYEGLVCPMIDARRMECYTMMVNKELQVLRPTSADVIEQGIFDSWLDEQAVTFIGDGAAKTMPLLGVHDRALFDNDFTISAEGMAEIASRKLAQGEVEDVAYFEPFYLKDFVAKKSTVHGLRD